MLTQFRVGIFDVKDASCTSRPVVENVEKITEIIKVDRHVSSNSIAQELKINHKTVFNHFRKRYRALNCNKTTMYYSIDMNFFYSKDNIVALHFKYDFWHMTATAGSDVVQSGRPIFDDFFQHLWPYIGNNTANVLFQMVKRLWLIRIDQ
ncbi:adhesion G protein-coupled receptor B2 [Trichonephila clavipes]|nr:adhesion G protein-coupled receptor B2 [Trichonephila clavipes]